MAAGRQHPHDRPGDPCLYRRDRPGGFPVTAEVITFGCRLNAADSDAMRALAAGGGETVIVNTCAVTGEAVRQARQAIRNAKRANPAAQVIVTGCAAQLDPPTFPAMPRVPAVLGNNVTFEPANPTFHPPHLHHL